MTQFHNKDFNDTELLNLLEGFGLGSREALIYATLNSIGKTTVHELSRRTRTERSDTYRVLRNLIRKGFVIKILDNPTRYTVISPKKAFKDQIEEKKREVENLEGSIEQIVALLESSKRVNIPYDSESRFELIKTRKNLYDRVKQMISSEAAKQEFLLISTEVGVRRLLSVFLDSLVNAKRLHTTVRCLIPVTEQNLNEIKTLSLFADIRHIPVSAGRLLIVNRRETLHIYSPYDTDSISETEEVGFWSNNKPFSEMQGLMFDSQWQLAMDLHSRIWEIERKSPEENSEFFTKRRIISPIEDSQTVVFLIDSSGKIVYVSNNISLITGRAIQTYLNKFVGGLIEEASRDIDKQKLLLLWEKAKKGESGVDEFQTSNDRGDVIWWSASWLSIRNQQGTLSSIRVILKNITEDKKISLLETE